MFKVALTYAGLEVPKIMRWPSTNHGDRRVAGQLVGGGSGYRIGRPGVLENFRELQERPAELFERPLIQYKSVPMSMGYISEKPLITYKLRILSAAALISLILSSLSPIISD